MNDYYDDYGEPVDLKETIKKSIQELAQEQNTAVQQAEINRTSQKILGEYGLTQEDVAKYLNENPNVAKQLIERNMKDNAAAIARSRDPKTGRFVSGKPKPQTHRETPQDDFWQPSKPVKQTSVMGMGRRHEESLKEKWKKGENRTGTDTEVLDMLTDMIGSEDATFKTTKL